MGAIGLNPIRLDAIGLDPIRFNAIRLGVPGASSATDRPYISPDVLSSLAGVWIADGKSNTDPDRNIIKNKLPGRGGDFEILNAAYKLNSGFGKYAEDFSTMKDYGTKGIVRTSSKIYLDKSFDYDKGFWLCYTNSPSPAYKVRVSGIPETGMLTYAGGVWVNLVNGINELPARTNTEENHGFVAQTPNVDWSKLVIEQIPEHEGAFVTDGVDDMIVSQNTVSEMLSGSNELTVVSMIHQIKGSNLYVNGLTNYIRNKGGFIRNVVANSNNKGLNKAGIYGYTSSQLDSSNMHLGNVINNILGDKEDYTFERSSTYTLDDAKYSVQSYLYGDSLVPEEIFSVAWYWTFIAKRVLTTDEINQVIAYFNLDKYVKPDIYYDVKKQGLTNDNHAQFGDKLIDYSGNSRDLQLFNIGWNLGSGIGKYVTNFGLWSKDAESNISYNSYSLTVNSSLKRTWLMWYVTELPSFKIKVSGINSNGYVDYGYYDNGSLKNFRLDKDGIHTLPFSGASSNGHGFKVNDTSLDWTGLVIEQIPDFAGALCFDGVDDFGINKDVPTFTDFTVIAKRTWLEENTSDKPFIIKGDSLYPDGNQNAFLFEYGKLSTYSFGQNNKYDESVVPSLISYATTYSYNGVIPLVRGSATDTIGIDVAHSTKIALYFLMLFPYSMSEFLIERQLKKHKLGTLYPGMVEFRPIVKSNIPYSSISYSVNPGEYVIEGRTVTITITLSNSSDKLVDISSNAISDISISGDNGVYEVTGKVTKSPQKINIVISSYLTMLDNETLITNETLIKNE